MANFEMFFHYCSHVSPEFGDFKIQKGINNHGMGLFLVTGVLLGLVEVVEETGFEVICVSLEGHGAGVQRLLRGQALRIQEFF